MFSNSRVFVFFNALGKVSASIANIICTTQIIWIYRQRIVDLSTVVNKLLIHKQPWKTWETNEVNQLHLTPMFEFKAMKANEEDFYSFYVLCRVYTVLNPLVHLLERSQSESVTILHFFVGRGVGVWFNALITSTCAWRNVYRDLCTSKRGDEFGSPQYLKRKKYLQVSLHHVRKFQKAIGTYFCQSKCLVDCRIQLGSLKLFLAKYSK